MTDMSEKTAQLIEEVTTLSGEPREQLEYLAGEMRKMGEALTTRGQHTIEELRRLHEEQMSDIYNAQDQTATLLSQANDALAGGNTDTHHFDRLSQIQTWEAGSHEEPSDVVKALTYDLVHLQATIKSQQLVIDHLSHTVSWTGDWFEMMTKHLERLAEKAD